MTAVSSFEVETLGECSVNSPIRLSTTTGDDIYNYVADTDRVLLDPTLAEFEKHCDGGSRPASFEMAGPRSKIFFDPSKTRVAIVTCGGLCPGLNDVIRAIVMELHYHYKTTSIFGIRYGYSGFLPQAGHQPLELTPETVKDIHTKGGTLLGSSRGGNDVPGIVDAIERMNINMLFTIGGDGTQRGAAAIHQEAADRGLKLAVIGIPKTIDNDLPYVEKSFGFETAFSMAVSAISGAHVEAQGAYNGVGIVKLMGRHSGFIAANAALAMNDVNFVLIPEVRFDLQGENGFLEHLRARLLRRHHAVICVAEGVGQDWKVEDRHNTAVDASGNRKLKDVGPLIKDIISKDLSARNIPFSTKYIDPSYIIRSAPAVPTDSVFCTQLGQNAVHAGMAGKAGILMGRWNGLFTHIPLSAVVDQTNRISPESSLWWNVIEATGQPMDMTNP